MLKLNSVTWYSKLLAIIIFVGVIPALSFIIGMRYEEVEKLNDPALIAKEYLRFDPLAHAFQDKRQQVKEQKFKAHIKNFTTKDGQYYITADYFEFIDDASGTVEKIKSENGSLFTLRLTDDVLIKLTHRKIEDQIVKGNFIVELPEFQAIFASKDDFRKTNPWLIVVNNNEVVELEEVFMGTK